MSPFLSSVDDRRSGPAQYKEDAVRAADRDKMTVTNTQPVAPRRKRRWFQFSLRTLLVFVLLVGIGMSWFAVKVRQAREQKEVVEAISQAGGSVLYDWVYSYDYDPNEIPKPPGPIILRKLFGDDFLDTVVEVEIQCGDPVTGTAPPLPTGFLDHLEQLPELRTLLLDDAEISADDMRRISELSSLERLTLASASFREDGWEHVKEPSRLTELDLSGSRISDGAMTYFGRLRDLNWLDLSFSNAADDGLQHLRGLTRLRFLNLEQCHLITDAGLAQLTEMKELETLNLNTTSVTEAGWKHFQAFPKLEELHIDCFQASEQDIAELESLTSLRFLHLGCTTGETFARLRRRLPNVVVSFGFSGYDLPEDGFQEDEVDGQREFELPAR